MEHSFTRDQYRAAATALYERQLYREAIDTYQEYLRSPAITQEDVPNVLYQMGVIYQENLIDPEGALAKFTVVKALYPDKTFENQLGKRMVACLESMGRSVDATQARSRITDLNQDTAKTAGGGAVVADLDGPQDHLGRDRRHGGQAPGSAPGSEPTGARIRGPDPDRGRGPPQGHRGPAGSASCASARRRTRSSPRRA